MFKIGLAVGDIHSIKKNARLKRIANQIYMYIDLEKRITRKLLNKYDQMHYIYYHGTRSNVFKDFFRGLSSCKTFPTQIFRESVSKSNNLALEENESPDYEPFIETEDTDTKLKFFSNNEGPAIKNSVDFFKNY